MIIGIDFDGTIVKNAFPKIGEEAPGAIAFMRTAISAGDSIILFTVRSGMFLDNAVSWLGARGIKLYGVNKNPEQQRWSSSVKPFCNFYIDDRAVGCPMIYPEGDEDPYVDWIGVNTWFDNQLEGQLGSALSAIDTSAESVAKSLRGGQQQQSAE